MWIQGLAIIFSLCWQSSLALITFVGVPIHTNTVINWAEQGDYDAIASVNFSSIELEELMELIGKSFFPFHLTPEQERQLRECYFYILDDYGNYIDMNGMEIIQNHGFALEQSPVGEGDIRSPNPDLYQSSLHVPIGQDPAIPKKISSEDNNKIQDQSTKICVENEATATKTSGLEDDPSASFCRDASKDKKPSSTSNCIAGDYMNMPNLAVSQNTIEKEQSPTKTRVSESIDKETFEQIKKSDPTFANLLEISTNDYLLNFVRKSALPARQQVIIIINDDQKIQVKPESLMSVEMLCPGTIDLSQATFEQLLHLPDEFYKDAFEFSHLMQIDLPTLPQSISNIIGPTLLANLESGQLLELAKRVQIQFKDSTIPDHVLVYLSPSRLYQAYIDGKFSSDINRELLVAVMTFGNSVLAPKIKEGLARVIRKLIYEPRFPTEPLRQLKDAVEELICISSTLHVSKSQEKRYSPTQLKAYNALKTRISQFRHGSNRIRSIDGAGFQKEQSLIVAIKKDLGL